MVDTDTRNNAKLKLAFKIDNIRNKNERYDSHVAFLKRCVDSDIIPNGLKCYVEPSIGNRDEEFLNEWHAILNECSKKLMNLTIEYSEKTKENTTTQIKTLTNELKDMVSDSTYKNIASSLKKNEESRTKDLVQRKNRKFYRLKYGEKEREAQAQPRVNNRDNEIWNNRSQRGQGTRTSEDRQERERTQRRWNEDRRDDNNRSSRYANNNFSSERNEDRILDVIDRRNQRDAPIHERIVGRRRSRRNIHERNDPVEDFPPLRASPREDNPRNMLNPRNENNSNTGPRESPREDNHDTNSRESNSDREIAKLREQVSILQRERVETSRSTSDQSKNEWGAQGPSKETPVNQDEIRAYIRTAMETLQGFETRLNQQTNTGTTHSDKL